MRYKITSNGFPTVTISKIEKGKKFYAERNSVVASSPIAGANQVGGLSRRRLMITELEGEEYASKKMPTEISQLFADFMASTKQTIDRKRIGERSYVLYEALEDGQKITFRSCCPGTIMRWNASPLASDENYLNLPTDGRKIQAKTIFEKGDSRRPHGVFMAVRGSFLVAELEAKALVYHTGSVSVRRFSETDDSFQRFEGNGNVFLEVHGDLQEIPLYPNESVDVFPGYLLGFTEGVSLEMKAAGDITLRNEENNDYVIRLTAGSKGGYVYTHSVKVSDFFAKWGPKK